MTEKESGCFPSNQSQEGTLTPGENAENPFLDVNAANYLEQIAAKLAAIVESSEDAIISKSLEGIVETWNRSAEEIFEYSAEEMIGKSITLIIPAERQNEEAEILERVRRGERISHYETERITKNGRRIDVALTVSPIRDMASKVIGVSKIARDITEYKKAREKLRSSEIRYKALFNTADDAIFLMENGVFVDCNPKALEMFGCQRRDIINEPPDHFSPPLQPDGRRSQEKALEKIQGALEGKLQLFEWKHCRKDGLEFDAEVKLNRIEIEQHPMLLATVRDISDRKKRETKLQRQAEFDSLITKILARFASCSGSDLDGAIQRSLEEAGRFLGTETAFVVAFSANMNTWSAVFEACAAGAPSFISRYQNVPMGTRPWIEQRLLTGEIVQIEKLSDFPPDAAAERESLQREGVKSTLLLPLRGRSEQLVGAVGLRSYQRFMTWLPEDVQRMRIIADAIANALERKRVEIDLHASRQMLQQILDTIPQRVFWKDLESVYLGCNQPFANDINLADPKEIVGKSDFQFPAGEDFARKYRADDREVITTGKEKIGYEEQQPRPDGTIAWLRTSKIPLRDPQNRIFGILGTYEDITDLRKAREVLKQAKEAAEAANRAKDQFIAVLSHELRTPLTPVLATVSALREAERLPKWMKEDMEVIQRNVELEARLIDDLLDVTRIVQGKISLRMEPLDAHACLVSALGICENEIASKHLDVSLKFNAENSHVLADSTRLRQVFWNLFNNAIKFTPEYGYIEICTSNEGSNLKINVADNGIGIEPETLSRIFHAFEQGELSSSRQFGGLGLGLSIARSLVEMHHGSLFAFSEGKGKGAVFTILLQAIQAEREPEKEPEKPKEQNLKSQRILLVDDHADTLRILGRLLRKWGYQVTTAHNVASALERASEDKFDLLISDIGLPDGNGRDIIREIKRHYNVESVALSGYGTDEDIRASREAGFSEHLTKPVSFQGLQTTVERLLNASGK